MDDNKLKLLQKTVNILGLSLIGYFALKDAESLNEEQQARFDQCVALIEIFYEVDFDKLAEFQEGIVNETLTKIDKQRAEVLAEKQLATEINTKTKE